MPTHHIFVLPFQKPRQRDPVPDLPGLHPRHSYWGGTLPAPEEGPQPPDDWGVPGQQQKTVQQGCPGVSMENSSSPSCPFTELPAHPALLAPASNLSSVPLHFCGNFTISTSILVPLIAFPSNVFASLYHFNFSFPKGLSSSSWSSAPQGVRLVTPGDFVSEEFCDSCLTPSKQSAPNAF